MRRLWTARRGDACAAALFVVFFAIFFQWVWLNRVFVIGGDAFASSYPLRRYFWDDISRGTLPLWLPGIFAGFPALAVSQLGAAYPLTWGYLVLPARWAEQVYVLAPFLLASLFTYAYAREVGRSRAASLLAGLTFAYGGATTNINGVIAYPTNAVIWLPLVLVGVERARTRGFAPSVAACAAAYAMSVLTGYGQGFMIVAMVALPYAALLSLPSVNSYNQRSTRVHAEGEARVGNHGEREASTRDYDGHGPRARNFADRLRPLAACACGIALGAGVGAYQILETMRAARRSVRGKLLYPFFVSGSFSPRVAIKSLLAPLYVDRFADVTMYVPPLALSLAALACFAALRRARAGGARSDDSRSDVSRGGGPRGDDRRSGGPPVFPVRDARALFWLAVAFVSCVLILGDYTPLYPLLYHVPVYNLFGTPSRHANEWTFALAALAAYGLDYARDFARARADDDDARPSRARLIAAALLVAALLVGAAWARAAGARLFFAPGETAEALRAWGEGAWYAGLPVGSYAVWKILFNASALACVWFAFKARGKGDGRRAAPTLLALSISVACFFEPFVMVRRWWQPFAKTEARLETPAPATRWLAEHAGAGERVYPRSELYADEHEPSPRVDPANVTLLYGLESVTGSDPLTPARYSRALGDVFLDGVTPLPGHRPSLDLFAPRSRVLDLLCARYAVLYDRDPPEAWGFVEKGGVKFSAKDFDVELRGGEGFALSAAPGSRGDTLALVTSLSGARDLKDDEAVARVKASTADGDAAELTLRAGRDTAEWSHESAEVRPVVRHRLAPVFDELHAGAARGFPEYRYLALLPLGGPRAFERFEITNLTPRSTLTVWKATLYDSGERGSRPLARDFADAPARLDARRWRRVFSQDRVFVFENARSLPRAWLVAEAEAVDGEESLRRIRGEGARDFDPLKTALLEVRPEELPPLAPQHADEESNRATNDANDTKDTNGAGNVEGTNGADGVGRGATGAGGARFVERGPNRLIVETDAATPTVLVVSEMFYPGWEASVDGRAAKIYLADYLLRAVALPAGRHRVEMRYVAPAARVGAIISALAFVLIVVLGFGGGVRRGLSRRGRGER